jgi:voltage-gated potassium channel
MARIFGGAGGAGKSPAAHCRRPFPAKMGPARRPGRAARVGRPLKAGRSPGIGGGSAQILYVASTSSRPLSVPLRLILFGSAPALLIGVGTVGFRAIERLPWFESLYVTVITLTSVGYGDNPALSTGGRVLTLALAIGGISTIAVAASELIATIVNGELRDYVEKWRMEKDIGALEQHVIVCGYGHVGQHVCADLLADGVPVVVVDRRAAPLAAARGAGAHSLLGDATADTTLRRAGIDRARALIAVAGTDPDNVLITMTARLLRPLLPIVSRADEEATLPKLLRAGATRTARPHAIAGGRMAEAVLHPAVLDADLRMEEQVVLPGSGLDGQTVASSGLRARRGRILVAIKRLDGHVTFNPEDDATVAAGDILISLGSPEPADGSDERARP